ncbi:MAG TPA: hypothetical protein VFW11_07125, partial [Cyclobacteriaceae bacterium]|nr:hypothetical protein [Cyclobacteriaceae bacterium]
SGISIFKYFLTFNKNRAFEYYENLICISVCDHVSPRFLRQQGKAVKGPIYGKSNRILPCPGSQYEISGTITLREKIDGTTFAEIELTGTSGNLQHPVHLHADDISAENADIIAQLNPVDGKTGKSTTLISMLADESSISYNELKKFAGCIKVHLAAAGPERDIILAAGNIGDLMTANSSGRVAVGTCKSE